MYGNKFICTPRCNRLGLCHLALSFACSFPQFVVGIVPIAHSSFFRSPAFSCIIHFKYVYHQQFEEKTMATICSEYTNSNRTALFFFFCFDFVRFRGILHGFMRVPMILIIFVCSLCQQMIIIVINGEKSLSTDFL